MKRITVDYVMSYKPCDPPYTKEYVKELFAGRKWMSPKTVLKVDIPVEDKLWLLLREDFLSEKNQRLFACDCAERVLHIYEEEYKNDDRPRKAIETSRLFAEGNATQEELSAAGAAARAAAGDAAWAARAAWAAWDAAWAAGAAAGAARDAAWAAGDAEQKWQVERLEYYLSQQG